MTDFIDKLKDCEPAPAVGTRPVAPKLRRALLAMKMDGVLKAVEARAQFGLKKYGTHLYADNGRDHVVDLAQELADAVQYLAAAQMCGRQAEARVVLNAFRHTLVNLIDAMDALDRMDEQKADRCPPST